MCVILILAYKAIRLCPYLDFKFLILVLSSNVLALVVNLDTGIVVNVGDLCILMVVDKPAAVAPLNNDCTKCLNTGELCTLTSGPFLDQAVIVCTDGDEASGRRRRIRR